MKQFGGLFAAVLLSFLYTTSASALESGLAAKGFVQNLNDQLLSVLGQKSSGDEQFSVVCGLVERYADVTKMADDSLGKNRRRFPADLLPAYHAAYHSMLSEMLGKAYERMLSSKVSIQDLVSGTEEEPTVTALVEAQNRSPLRVQFFLRSAPDTGFKLVDAAMAGARLVLAKRSSFDTLLAVDDAQFPSAVQTLISNLTSSSRSCSKMTLARAK